MENNYNLDYLFNKSALYSSFEFGIWYEKSENVFSFDEEEYEKMTKILGLRDKKIICNCTYCKNKFPFDVFYRITKIKETEFEEVNSFVCTSSFGGNFPIWFNLDFKKQPVNTHIDVNKEKFINQSWILEYKLVCCNDDKHSYSMSILINFEDGKFKIIKIGQFPSTVDLNSDDLKRFEKTLEKYNAFEDYKKAVRCNSFSFYAGSYAYLRRVFEKQIDFYIKENSLSVSSNHTSDKIELVKQYFSPDVKNILSNLYSFLSIGIHQLTEIECKEHFLDLRAVIDLQLVYEKTEKEKQDELQTLNKRINQMVNKYKK